MLLEKLKSLLTKCISTVKFRSSSDQEKPISQLLQLTPKDKKIKLIDLPIIRSQTTRTTSQCAFFPFFFQGKITQIYIDPPSSNHTSFLNPWSRNVIFQISVSQLDKTNRLYSLKGPRSFAHIIWQIITPKDIVSLNLLYCRLYKIISPEFGRNNVFIWSFRFLLTFIQESFFCRHVGQ